jgi:hypothetical protein
MTSLTSYLLVILIVLIILLTITYTTDYITLPSMPKLFTKYDDESSSSDIEHEKKHKHRPQQVNQVKQVNQVQQQFQTQQQFQSQTNPNNFLIETNESDNINNKLFSGIDDFQMTETTGNAIADALRDI